ncbi:unnamed protein product, partial [Mesorhabditis belari]|uniref:Sulfotransferase n=1 Tax=Mesorhabditis belari TaxID=2138241 RepID=A0AAF3FPD9_9BILA
MAPNGRLIFLLFYLIFAIDGAPIGHKEKRFPSAIIIGVKKAGTRALLEFLRLNQKIHAPGPERFTFSTKTTRRDSEWYRISVQMQLIYPLPHQSISNLSFAYILSSLETATITE